MIKLDPMPIEPQRARMRPTYLSSMTWRQRLLRRGVRYWERERVGQRQDRKTRGITGCVLVVVQELRIVTQCRLAFIHHVIFNVLCTRPMATMNIHTPQPWLLRCRAASANKAVLANHTMLSTIFPSTLAIAWVNCNLNFKVLFDECIYVFLPKFSAIWSSNNREDPLMAQFLHSDFALRLQKPMISFPEVVCQKAVFCTAMDPTVLDSPSRAAGSSLRPARLRAS